MENTNEFAFRPTIGRAVAGNAAHQAPADASPSMPPAVPTQEAAPRSPTDARPAWLRMSEEAAARVTGAPVHRDFLDAEQVQIIDAALAAVAPTLRAVVAGSACLLGDAVICAVPVPMNIERHAWDSHRYSPAQNLSRDWFATQPTLVTLEDAGKLLTALDGPAAEIQRRTAQLEEEARQKIAREKEEVARAAAQSAAHAASEERRRRWMDAGPRLTREMLTIANRFPSGSPTRALCVELAKMHAVVDGGAADTTSSDALDEEMQKIALEFRGAAIDRRRRGV